MSTVSFVCTNPNCQRQIVFEQTAVGTVQQCPFCTQRLIVPDAAPLAPQVAVMPAYTAPTMHISTQQPPAHQQERHIESQTARKLNMGSGCFAMIAVIFAFAILSFGASQVLTSINPNANTGVVGGILLMLGGLAGLGAFVFFGYIATETSSSSKGSERR